MDNNQLNELPNSRRGYESIRFNLRGVIDRMRDIKPDASIREILKSAQMMGRFKQAITPNPILEFVRAFISKTGCKSLFVPFASGIEVEELRAEALTVSFSTPNYDLRELIQGKTGVSAISEDAIDEAAYDVIFSDLPFGSIHKGCIQQKIVDECVGRLAQKGVGIFTFANNIVFGFPAKRWLAELSEKGIYVSAIIDLPEGLYEPMTFISSKIVLFSKEKADKLFLAKLKRESDAPVIVDYYLSKSNSPKSETLGKWFDHNTFPDFASYENEQRRQRTAIKLEKAYNGKLMQISEISTAVKAPKRTDTPFDEAENAIYIPKLGKSEVVTSLNELHIKPQNYFQILVDQEKILPEFLKFFFNTDNGVTRRLRAMAGTILSLNVGRIKAIEVPVPSLKTQASVLEVYEELNKIELEASRLRDRLEDVPASYSNIAKEIKDINNKGDKFEQWVESLPYPLATILKRYTASDTYQQKQEMLFYFFEAYSIFIAAILTAVYQQPQFSNSEIEDVGVAYFEKASFGSWVKMDQALAKIFRIRMDNPNLIDSVLNSFHTDDQSLVKLISLGDVYSILQRTCDYRNAWKGHSGITSEAIYTEHVRVLEGELFKLQERLKDLYEKICLVRPLSLKRRQGKFINKVEVLTGSNSIFKKDEISGDALDEDKLYIQVKDTGVTFEIPPFFVLKNSPADVKNACYFYSRLEGSNSRYVSYHFEGKPENIEEGEAAFDIIKAVLERTNSK